MYVKIVKRWLHNHSLASRLSTNTPARIVEQFVKIALTTAYSRENAENVEKKYSVILGPVTSGIRIDLNNIITLKKII